MAPTGHLRGGNIAGEAGERILAVTLVATMVVTLVPQEVWVADTAMAVSEEVEAVAEVEEVEVEVAEVVSSQMFLPYALY